MMIFGDNCHRPTLAFVLTNGTLSVWSVPWFDAFSFRLGFSKRVKWSKPRKRKLVSNKLNGHVPRRHLFPTGFERKASPTFLFVTKIPRTAIGKNVKSIGRAWNSFNYGRPRSVIRRDRAMGWSSLGLLVTFKLALWTVIDRAIPTVWEMKSLVVCTVYSVLFLFVSCVASALIIWRTYCSFFLLRLINEYFARRQSTASHE